jgi:protein phosphatase
MMYIPLHSLVIVASNKDQSHQLWFQHQISPHELVCFSHLRQQITGRTDNTMHDGAVWRELYDQIHKRLSHGQRVVVHAPTMNIKDVEHVSTISHQWGVPLRWIVVDATHTQLDHVWTQTKKRIMNLKQPRCEVVTDHMQFELFKLTSPTNRILAVGDVHGNYSAMCAAVDQATQEDRFIVWLGDVIDYGNANLKCMKLAYQTVAEGRAHMIWGNHERKIGKWIAHDCGKNFRGRLSEANWSTLREIEHLAPERRARFLAAWRALENWSTQHVVVKNYLFTHGAATPEMWSTPAHRLTGIHSDRAFFGEVDSSKGPSKEGYPARLWSWVEQVPPNHSVIVGHDWLDRASCEVVRKTNSQGGQVLCVDTGSSKGGRLSGVAIDVETNNVEYRYFDT